MSFDGKNHTWEEVARIIGYEKGRKGAYKKFHQLFRNTSPFSNDEMAASMTFAIKYNLRAMQIPGRSLEQSREIFSVALEKSAKIQEAVTFEQNKEANRAMFEMLDIIEKQKKEIEKQKQEIERLKAMLNAVNKAASIGLKTDENTTFIINNLRILLNTAIENAGKASSNGNRYPEEIENFFILLSICGEHVYNIVKMYIGLPCYKTALQHKQKLYKQVFGEEGDIKDLYNGSPENVEKLLHVFLENFNEKEDVVLAIDACSLNSNVRIKADGSVTGLTNTFQISPKEADLYLNNYSAFNSFLQQHYKEIISAAFVVLLIPVDPTKHAFPILAKQTASGSATEEIEQLLKQLDETVTSLGHNVLGYGCDGDVEWLHYGYEFLDVINENFENELDLPLQSMYSTSNIKQIFYDTLHIGKNLRYYLANGVPKCLWLTTQEPTITKEGFISCGLNEQYFSNSLESKLYDFYPREIFTPSSIAACIDKNRYDLAFSLLPMTLLFESVFNASLSRDIRLQYLSIAHAIMLIYIRDFDSYKRYHIKDKTFQKENNGKNVTKQVLYQKKLVVKFLMLTYGLAKHISNGTPIHIGALGTHKLEHWFGNLRRSAQGNDSPEKFNQIVKKTVLHNYLCHDLNIDTKSEKRSDSGTKLFDSKKVESIAFGKAIFIAYKIIKDTGIILINERQWQHITSSYKNSETDKISNILNLYTLADEKPKTSRSARQNGLGFGAGVKQIARNYSSSDVKNAGKSQNDISKPTFRSIHSAVQHVNGFFNPKLPKT